MYNATVYRSDHDGNLISVFAAEATDDGAMLRSSAVQCTGYEGGRQYDSYVRSVAFAGCQLRVELDGAAGYRQQISRLAMPATYR
jgi:hypothetical protein